MQANVYKARICNNIPPHATKIDMIIFKGPFPGDKMKAWFDLGYFQKTTKCKLVGEEVEHRPTQKHTQTNACTHTHARMHARVFAHLHTDVCTHACAHCRI